MLERPPHAVADRPRAQPGRRPLPPLVHAVDPRGPGARRGLLRLRRLDLGGLLRHARRPHRASSARPSASPPTRRAPTGRCSPSTARAARTGSCCGCSRWSARTRSCSSRATSTTRSSTRSRPSGWTSASCRRRTTPRFEALLPPSVDADPRGPAPLPRGARGHLHVADLRGPGGEHARDRRAPSTRRRRHALVIVDEAWGGHLHFHPELPPSRRWRRAPTSACSRRTSSPAGCSRPACIHWREGRVDSELMEEAYREYVTTSPSYHLLGVAPTRRCARSRRRARRRSARAIARTARAQGRRCASALPDLDYLDDAGLAARGRAPTSPGCDLVKTTVGLVALPAVGLRRRRARSSSAGS